jgi:hypothetical protein
MTKEEILEAKANGTLDEVCTCGHYKSEHTGVNGHGSCCRDGCACAWYTWVAFVVRKEVVNGDSIR